MSKKYIRQINDENYIYPNNTRALYDIDIIHDVNDNCVSGSVTTLSATTVTSTGITLSYNFTWSSNGAEKYITNASILNCASLSILPPGLDFANPFRTVQYFTGTTTGTTSQTFSGTTVITPSDFGLTSFQGGNLYYELRFIGALCLKKVVGTIVVGAIPTPTPTPTPTASSTPTPTPTPTSTPTPTPTSTGGGNELIVYAKYINSSDEIGYTLNGGTYLGIGEVPSTTCTLMAVLTGVTNGDAFVFSCLLNSSIGGSTTDCPISAGGCNYNYTYTGSGTQFVYLTIDGSDIC